VEFARNHFNSMLAAIGEQRAWLAGSYAVGVRRYHSPDSTIFSEKDRALNPTSHRMKGGVPASCAKTPLFHLSDLRSPMVMKGLMPTVHLPRSGQLMIRNNAALSSNSLSLAFRINVSFCSISRRVLASSSCN
jgi:hypothetical protein